jgi:hypothetical protein
VAGDIVAIADFLATSHEPAVGSGADVWDTFLRDEGLELLANYRAIQDGELRRKIRALVEMVARDQRF